MFIKFHERLSREQEGFTLIELLVVVLIIAILAAIAIPVFLRQRQRGWVAQVQSSLKNAATAEESYATANNGSYTASLTDLQGQGFNSTADVTVTPSLGTTEGYCILATHAQLPAGHEWKTAGLVGAGTGAAAPSGAPDPAKDSCP